MLFSFFFNEERDVDDCPPSFPSSFYLRADKAGLRNDIAHLSAVIPLIDPATPRDALEERVAVSFVRFLDFMAEDRALTEIGFFQPPSCSVTKSLMVDWVAASIRQEQEQAISERTFRR